MPSLVSVSFSTARAPWHVKEKFPFFFFFGISLGLECSLWGWAALWEAGPGSSVVSPVKSGTWCQLTGHSPNLRLCILQFPFYLECSERLREVHQGRESQALSPAELVSICTQPAGIAPFQSLPSTSRWEAEDVQAALNSQEPVKGVSSSRVFDVVTAFTEVLFDFWRHPQPWQVSLNKQAFCLCFYLLILKGKGDTAQLRNATGESFKLLFQSNNEIEVIFPLGSCLPLPQQPLANGL